MYQKYIKIVLDKLVASITLVILSPIFISLIVIHYLYQRKVFFTQIRIGKNKKPFTIYKFQTMNERRNSKGELLPDELRITSLGRFVRKTSLDELPQLINVLKGNMSIIGPRPLLTNYAHLYTDYQNQRHQVLPGITGYVQVKGRNTLTWNERFDLDVYYVNHISFLLDCKILFLTLISLFDFKKSFPQNGISIEPFEGQWN